MQGLRDKGYTLQDNEAEQLVSHLDVDFNGDVDYLDWLAAMIDWHQVWAQPCKPAMIDGHQVCVASCPLAYYECSM